MAEINLVSKVSVECNIQLILTEEEAWALDAICGYGPDMFVKWFYKNLGTSYLKPHEQAMRSLFEKVRAKIPMELRRVDKVRKFVKENL